ncbi:hypothetical protein C8F01DRAFT_1380657 [Mycena amicta]|nr:hypothetical protein C8F01DRAFT_1380657 [Mycena amicta]
MEGPTQAEIAVFSSVSSDNNLIRVGELPHKTTIPSTPARFLLPRESIPADFSAIPLGANYKTFSRFVFIWKHLGPILPLVRRTTHSTAVARESQFKPVPVPQASSSSSTSSEPDSAADDTDVQAPNVYINALPPHFTEEQLLAIVANFGEVGRLRVVDRCRVAMEARFSPSPPRPHEGVDISSDQRGATSLLRSKRGNAREGGHSNLMLQYDGRRGDIETRTQLLRCERTANSGLDEPKDTSCRLLRVHRRRTKVIVYPATHVLSMNELEPISSSFPVAAYLAPYSAGAERCNAKELPAGPVCEIWIASGGTKGKVAHRRSLEVQLNSEAYLALLVLVELLSLRQSIGIQTRYPSSPCRIRQKRMPSRRMYISPSPHPT